MHQNNIRVARGAKEEEKNIESGDSHAYEQPAGTKEALDTASNSVKELLRYSSSYFAAFSVKEYDDKDNNNATASFKGKFVAMNYESTDKKKEFDQKLAE
jgi:hypothetical protein